jgi:hypothetical protein
MQGLCTTILILASAGLVLLMIVQARRGTVELLSVRNFALLGFILFQLVSGAYSLWTEKYGVVVAPEPWIVMTYTALAVSFAGLVLWIYTWNWPAGALARVLGADLSSPPPASMLVLAYGFMGLGLVVRFGLVYIPFVGGAMTTVGTGLILVSVSMVAWAWTPRLLNPAVGFAALPIVGVALFSVLAGAFGRRDLVGFVGACAWGAYHAHWKHVGLRQAAPGLAVIGVIGLLLFGAMSATRDPEKLLYDPGQIAGRLTSRSPWGGLIDLATGQMAAANSMYLMESRPRDIPYDTLHTARYALFHPIPRYFWPEKPRGLGEVMPSQINIPNVGDELNIGPGIIGHIWNDNPWLAFPLYALIIAMTLRFLDELIRRCPSNPFVLLPMAVGVGEVVGLARGEAGLFYVRAMASTLGAWIAMAVVARLFRSLGWIRPTEYVYEAAPDQGAEGDEPGAPDWATGPADEGAPGWEAEASARE